MTVLVLMGGMSSEREVSVHSGEAVAQGLRDAGHKVLTYQLGPEAGRDVFHLVTSEELKRSDVVFIALHGGEGEDGRIQALLELLGKPYTGSGVRASAICMDKAISKMIFERHGISTPPWSYLPAEVADRLHAEEAAQDLGGLPVVVKPLDQGSTIGISIVREASQMEAAISLALSYSRGLILEKYIAGRELSVPIIEDQVYPVIEIEPQEGFYDYRRKYTKGLTTYQCPAHIDRDLFARIQEDAMKAYRVLGCEGFARVDVRLGDDGRPYFLEVNTIPGMTETSLVPMGAKAKGISFPELVDRITCYALRRSGIGEPKSEVK